MQILFQQVRDKTHSSTLLTSSQWCQSNWSFVHISRRKGQIYLVPISLNVCSVEVDPDFFRSMTTLSHRNLSASEFLVHLL